MGARKCNLGHFGVQRSQCQLRRGQLGHGRQGRRAPPCVDACQRRCGFVEPPDQQQPARRDQTRLQRVGLVSARFECSCRRGQRAGGLPQLAHRQCHFGLGDHAAGVRQFLMRAEAACRAPQQLASTHELAELGHRDAAQRERRRVVSQRDTLERAKRVARGEGAGGCGDEGVHAGGG